MNTYYTKCGRKFTKSTKADTTGFHINENGQGEIPDEKCSSCPFVVDVKEGWPNQQHKRYECRAGSKPPNHNNSWHGSLDDKCSIYIRSLDHAFCEKIIAYCSKQPDLAAAYNQDCADCRRTVSVSCSQNKKGIAAKKTLIDKLFSDKPTPDDESRNYKAKCPFLQTIGQTYITCGSPDCRNFGRVNFQSTVECQNSSSTYCFDRFLDCDHYKKYYADESSVKDGYRECAFCCNSSGYTGLPEGYDGQKYCFCQKKRAPMPHDFCCEWFDRHLDWTLPPDINGSQLKENTGMGKMSTLNIADAIKKAKQKTGALKFAPHPEDLPLASLKPNTHNSFAEQDDTASIEDIKADIERIGLINPIAVNHKESQYFILSGERRYHAITEINRENPEKYAYVRCSVYENLTFAEEMQVLYSANLKVRHYDAAQRLKYYQQLKDTLIQEKAEGHYDGPIQADIANIMGVTDRQVRKYDQINGELDDTEKQQIAAGKMSVDAAAKLATERRQEKKSGHTGGASESHKNVHQDDISAAANQIPLAPPVPVDTQPEQLPSPTNELSKIQSDFLQAIKDIELTEEERRTVDWLKSCEWQTLVNLTAIIQKAMGKAVEP